MTRDIDDQNMDPHDPDRAPDHYPDHDPEASLPDEHASESGMEQDHRNEGGRRQRREPRERLDSFEKMKVWQEAHQLALRVFANTPNLPAEQQAGLALQIEQAAVNVPKSIAEGFKRRGPRNKAHFYNIAQTTVESLRYYFILCRDLNYDIEYDDLANRAEQVSRMLDGLVRSMLR